MKINANKYEPKDINKIIREWTNKTQKDFGKDINKTNEWVKANESGKTNFYFKDFLELCKKNNIDITISKNKPDLFTSEMIKTFSEKEQETL